jgi:[NiFe] hydrogenase assembly HybE family chaperone
VEAVGFRGWEGHSLGVLVTPWFINLMLLPEQDEPAGPYRVGAKTLHRFPSGNYEFILCEEPGLGRYRMCSLFSPVHQFEDQAAAVATARACLEAIMDDDNHDACGFDQRQVERIWRGEAVAPAAGEMPEGASTGEGKHRGLSRRTFITGRLSGASE